MSIEPGRDGVGDYVRQIAQVLTSQGHSCQIVALADRFADQPGDATDPEYGFQIVRLPHADWQRGDIEFAVERVARFRPDWASLQMVCYGFEHRGMLWRSARRFARLRLAPRRHLMFHELWIGAWRNSSAKERAIGWVQRHLLLRALRIWSPQIVHTSNACYREMLRRVNVSVEELAIPSSIPVRELGAARARESLERRLNRSPGSAASPLLGGVFGNLPPELAAGDWWECLLGTCAGVGRELVIVQLGRAGPGGPGLISALRQRSAGRVQFLELGELPPAEVSAVFQGLDFGISSAPRPLIGKSSSTAAMLGHGLPVLVPRESEGLRGGAEPTPLADPQLLRIGDFCKALQSDTLQHAGTKRQFDVYERFVRALEYAS